MARNLHILRGSGGSAARTFRLATGAGIGMHQEAVQPALESEQSAKGAILVVDDDAFSRDLMMRRLSRAGFSVTVADGGRQGLERIGRQLFDLVLLDLVMPDLGGRDVLAAIRCSGHASEIPVIMVTSKNDSDDIAACFRIGANDYVTKPFEFRALVARIDRHIGRRRAGTAVRVVENGRARSVGTGGVELLGGSERLVGACVDLADALDEIGDGVVLWDADDRLVACNRRFRDHFGASAGGGLPGVRFADLMRRHAEKRLVRGTGGDVGAWLRERIARHENPQGAVEEELADGTWLRVSETRMRDGRTVGLYTDITEIKRREIAFQTFAETSRRLAAAVDAMSSVVLITDPRRPGNPTVYANPAFTAMTGWPVEEALGRNRMFLTGDPGDADTLARFDTAMREGRPARATLRLRARNGRDFRAEASASPIRDSEGRITHWVIIHTEITEGSDPA